MGSFDISHYADVHHAIFRGVYPFAGEFRTVDLHKWSDQRQDCTTFMPAEVIVPWLNRHLNEEVVKRGRFRDLGRDEFVDRTTRLYLDLQPSSRGAPLLCSFPGRSCRRRSLMGLHA